MSLPGECDALTTTPHLMMHTVVSCLTDAHWWCHAADRHLMQNTDDEKIVAGLVHSEFLITASNEYIPWGCAFLGLIIRFSD